MDSDIDAIDRRRDDWLAAVNAGDADRYGELLTEDVVWIPPGQSALQGRDAFEAWVRPFFERFSYDFNLLNPSVRRAGGWAVETGRFVSALTPPNEKTAKRHEGAYLVIWRKESDGAWRIERYVDMTSASS